MGAVYLCMGLCATWKKGAGRFVDLALLPLVFGMQHNRTAICGRLRRKRKRDPLLLRSWETLPKCSSLEWEGVVGLSSTFKEVREEREER